MKSIKFNLRARGNALLILLFLAMPALLTAKSDDIIHGVTKARVVKKMSIPTRHLPNMITAASIALAGYALYLALLARTTQVDVGRVNFALTKGIFVRRKDALDLTGVQDFRKVRTLLDMMLGISKFVIHSRDKTHPILTLPGVRNKDAELLYEHLVAYSNKSMVEYVQGHAERNRYNQKRGAKKDTTWSRQGLSEDHDKDDGSDD